MATKAVKAAERCCGFYSGLGEAEVTEDVKARQQRAAERVSEVLAELYAADGSP